MQFISELFLLIVYSRTLNYEVMLQRVRDGFNVNHLFARVILHYFM
jgi:hypothetical protein